MGKFLLYLLWVYSDFFLLLFFLFLAAVWVMWDLSSANQVLKPCSLLWKHGVNHWPSREAPVEDQFFFFLEDQF